MSSKEPHPITYYLVVYPVPTSADRTQFDAFLKQQQVDKEEANYVVFTSEESRIDVLRKCENALRAEFYYALAFERDDGFYIEAHPNAAARCLLALDASQQKEMTTSLFTIADVLAEKAKNHRKAQ